jgi:hypothetical protein
MNQTSPDSSSLPLQAMSEIPTPTADAVSITALVKESEQVIGYQLSDGRLVSKSEGVSIARQGGIKGVGIAMNSGTEYLKSLPDATEANNLSNLPSITQG